MVTIVTTFYTYVGVVGQHFLWVDIIIFILGTIIAYLFSFMYLKTEYFTSSFAILVGWIVLFILTFSFVTFTFSPPDIGLFLDTVAGTYT